MDARRIFSLRRSVPAAGLTLWTVRVLGVLLAAVLLVFLLPLIVPQSVTDRFVARQISRQTGMNAEWTSLRWQLLPSFKVVALNVRLVNPAFSTSAAVLETARLDIALRYGELLGGHLVADTVNVHQARMLIAREGTKASWQTEAIMAAARPSSQVASAPWYSRRFMMQGVARIPEVDIDQLDIDFQMPHFRQHLRTNFHLVRQNGLQLKAQMVSRPESDAPPAAPPPRFSLTADWHVAEHDLQIMARAQAPDMHDALFRFDGYFDPASPGQASGALTLDVPDPGRLWYLGDRQQEARRMAPLSLAASFVPGLPLAGRVNPVASVSAKKPAAPLFESDHVSLQIGAQMMHARMAFWPASGHAAVAAGSSESRLAGRPVLQLDLGLAHFDWPQFRSDLGLPPLPAKPPGELLSDSPYKWEWLGAPLGFDIDTHLSADTFRLYQKVTLTDPRLHAQIRPDRLSVPEFTFGLAHGVVSGHALFSGSSQQARVTLHGHNISLAAWRNQLDKPALFSGGDLDIDAQVSAAGASLKKLAATLQGPVKMRVHDTVVFSPKAARAENLFSDLLPMLTGHGEKQLQLSCVDARLWFEHGLATMAPAVGVQSAHSQVVGNGTVDLARQTLDLHGRLLPLQAKDMGLGNVLGDLQMTGPLGHPRISLDSRGSGLARNVLRTGAAVLTLGLSTAVVHAADLQQTPACAMVAGLPLKGPDEPDRVGTSSSAGTSKLHVTGERAVSAEK